MTEVFVYTSTIVFALLFLTWNRSDWANLFIKVAFFGLAATGTFISLELLGYVVRV